MKHNIAAQMLFLDIITLYSYKEFHHNFVADIGMHFNNIVSTEVQLT